MTFLSRQEIQRQYYLPENAKTFQFLIVRRLIRQLSESFIIKKFQKVRKPRESKKVIVTSQNFTESRFLAALVSVFIKARNSNDLSVEVLYNNGGSDKNIRDILDGNIDVYCTYTGQILEFFQLKNLEVYSKIKPINSNSKLVISKINEYLVSNLTVPSILDTDSSKAPKLVCPFGVSDDWIIIVRKDFSNKHNLNTISDLRMCKNLKTAVEEDFTKRRGGLSLLYQPNCYNLDIQKCLITKHEKVYDYLDGGVVELIDAFATDIRLDTSSNYKQLIDDKSLFKSYKACLMLSGRLLSLYPDLEKQFSHLEGNLSNQEIAQIIHQIDSTSNSNNFDYIEHTASEWLTSRQLI